MVGDVGAHPPDPRANSLAPGRAAAPPWSRGHPHPPRPEEPDKPTTIPCLWSDGQAEQAAALCTSVFPRSQITGTTRYGPDTPGPEGSVMTVDPALDGQPYVGLNGGPDRSTEAISFQVPCEDQAEVDHYWERLSEGGEQGPCGWLKDRFGVSWQVVPAVLPRLIADPDPGRAQRAVEAMLGMRKLVIAELEEAADRVPA